MACSNFALLSMSCFSLSSWQPAIINLVSSLRNSSVSILNFLSIAWPTWAFFSSFLYALSSSSLWAMRSLTYSGVSRLAMNSISYCLSSDANKLANLALLCCKLDSYLVLMSATLSLAILLIILLSDFASQVALRNMFLSPLIALWRTDSFWKN